MWSNGVGQNGETNEKHDEDCAEKKFQMARVKLDWDDEGGREALGVGNCGINFWDRSELELAWSNKPVYISKTIFQYSYYLVFRIHWFVRCVMLYVK